MHMASCASVIVNIHNALILTIFNLLHSSANQELFKKLFCNESNHYGQFPLRKEAIMS